jgi:hypothetical protein
MVNEFMQLAILINRLNKHQNILTYKDINEITNNMIDFTRSKNELLNCIRNLGAIDQQEVHKIIAYKRSDELGPISDILFYIDLYVMDYEWQFDQIRDFLYPFVKYYKHKAQYYKCTKESIKTNPIKNHYRTNCISGIAEIEDLIALLNTHNNYLGKDKVLSAKEINRGYRRAKELSAFNCDIQYLLQKIEQTDLKDICTMDKLLRALYGKTLICAKYIRSIIRKNTATMAKYYPDWDHVVDGVPYT